MQHNIDRRQKKFYKATYHFVEILTDANSQLSHYRT